MKRLKMKLTQQSIQETINALEKYKKELNEKQTQFMETLGKEGLTFLEVKLNEIPSLMKGNITCKMSLANSSKVIIEMEGRQVAFIEFGAGMLYNAPIGGTRHPLGGELGYTIGSYNPESPNASDPNGWWYTDENGQSEHTYGTPTFAPLYNTEMDILVKCADIAKRVFK